MQIVIEEGGPFHTRGHLRGYLDRLRETGRSRWADDLIELYPVDAVADRAVSTVRQRSDS